MTNMKDLAEFSWFGGTEALYCARESTAMDGRDGGSGRGCVPKSHSKTFEAEHHA